MYTCIRSPPRYFKMNYKEVGDGAKRDGDVYFDTLGDTS